MTSAKRNIFLLLIILIVFLASCGTQKRLASARTKAAATRELITNETGVLDSVQQISLQKLNSSELDTVTKSDFERVIKTLHANLKEIEEVTSAVELFATNRPNFSDRNYYADHSETRTSIAQLDVFLADKQKRERTYGLLKEAIRIQAYKLFDLAPFFEPGVFKVPPKAIRQVNDSFLPALDSLAYLCNKYKDIPRTAHIVLVGYADAVPVRQGTGLYNELSGYLKTENPGKEQLNEMLSALRARELLRSLKIVTSQNANKFTDYNHLKIGYSGYGRGEKLPFNNIHDYTENDERRRVVLFYWSLLPDVTSAYRLSSKK